ncbi:cell division protein ZapA [Paraurantiacibacter namhicola]|uniref:Cell division protein ZapA n=1 Tax=Paraurantiacibacter namhicola TaxID=645517 RepID=A0A1C7D8M8_9SPHN|nr:cell division protein ZapA [Paraurantiacibacter namhicola]ANU07846.1 Cell division protein ZapA [Paraurantiacibacter namhicola]
MSNVTVTLAGRKYTINCGEGEEPHIAMLAEKIDRRLSTIDNLAGQSAERTLLYGALLLADENYDLERGGAVKGSALADIAVPLENLADRLESLAAALEDGASTT